MREVWLASATLLTTDAIASAVVDLSVHWAGRGELHRLDVPVSSYGAPDVATITVGAGIALAVTATMGGGGQVVGEAEFLAAAAAVLG